MQVHWRSSHKESLRNENKLWLNIFCLSELGMPSYFLICMMIGIGVAPMIWEMHRGRFDLFNLKNPFIIYYLLQLAISGLLTLLTGSPSEIGLDPVGYSQSYVEAFAVSFVGLFLFQLGYYTQSAKAIKLPVLLTKPWVGNRYRRIVAISFTVGIGAFFLFLLKNGGLAEFLENREVFRAGGLVGQGIFLFPATSLLAVSTMIYFIGNVQVVPTKFFIVKFVLLSIIALFPAFFLGFRSALVLPMLQMIVIWHYAYRKINIGKLIVPLIAMGALFTVYGISREIPPTVDISPSVFIQIVSEKPELAYGIISRSRGTEVVASVINKLAQTGDYDLGWRSLFEFATIIVPKVIWEDKPQPSGVRFTTYFFASNLAYSRESNEDVWGGISPTVIGELYWHFGWFGVSIGLYFLGRLARLIYFTVQRNSTNPSIVVIYAIFYTSFAMFAEAIQGYINGLVMYGFIVVPILIILTRQRYQKLRGSF